ncbi:MAG: transketolase, partial [Phycisphaerae bacterium]|nr:transketolase [Phycisphaerae bacterium]
MASTAAIHRMAAELGKLVVRMTTQAGSGHPSSGLSLAHLVTYLMYEQMRYDPANPWEATADRLVLSEGHAVPIIYAAFANLGGAVGRDREAAVTLTPNEVDQLRARGSVLDGHPNPAEGFPFFDAATGSLGQGLSVAAGLAVAARLDGTDRRVYALIGDGEAREGQVWEAADFIVDHSLTNVCAIFSANGQGQAGDVSPQQSAERLAAKLTAFGWEVAEIDGHDPEAIAAAFSKVGTTDKPFAIVARTIKGWGVDKL